MINGSINPWPPGCEVLQWRESSKGISSAAVAINDAGNILVSDTAFCAVLSVLGVDALSDRPRSCGERMWWAFDVLDVDKIRQLASQFYSKYQPPLIDLAFVRIAMIRKKNLSQECKSKAANNHVLRPLTLRRMDAKRKGAAA